MAIRTELCLRLPNSPGALAGVCRALSDERLNILALALEPPGQLRLLVDNPLRGAEVLRGRHHRVSERDVVVLSVPHGAGGLAPSVALVAGAGVNVEYAYGAGSDTGRTAIIVLGVDDAQRASSMAGV